MTPFGEKIRQLRKQKGVSMKQMAQAIGVSAPYLSALEHGKRGQPSWYLVQRIVTYFNIIWDDAEELTRLARISHPRVVIDTSGLSSTATELANRLSVMIAQLDEKTLRHFLSELETSSEKPSSIIE